MLSLIKELHKKYSFVLVSRSPRRRAILKGLGFDFVVKVSHKSLPEEIRSRKYLKDVVTVTYNKINSIKTIKNKILIACDTIVVYNGRAFGKPRNKVEAKEFLKILSGRCHLVISCLAVKLGQEIFHDIATTKVFFRKITESEIVEYLKSSEPMDKAGAYAIQGLGKSFVRKIDGCFYNVVGLPINSLYKLLTKIRELK